MGRLVAFSKISFDFENIDPSKDLVPYELCETDLMTNDVGADFSGLNNLLAHIDTNHQNNIPLISSVGTNSTYKNIGKNMTEEIGVKKKKKKKKKKWYSFLWSSKKDSDNAPVLESSLSPPKSSLERRERSSDSNQASALDAFSRKLLYSTDGETPRVLLSAQRHTHNQQVLLNNGCSVARTGQVDGLGTAQSGGSDGWQQKQLVECSPSSPSSPMRQPTISSMSTVGTSAVTVVITSVSHSPAPLTDCKTTMLVGRACPPRSTTCSKSPSGNVSPRDDDVDGKNEKVNFKTDVVIETDRLNSGLNSGLFLEERRKSEKLDSEEQTRSRLQCECFECGVECGFEKCAIKLGDCDREIDHRENIKRQHDSQHDSPQLSVRATVSIASTALHTPVTCVDDDSLDQVLLVAQPVAATATAAAAAAAAAAATTTTATTAATATTTTATTTTTTTTTATTTASTGQMVDTLIGSNQNSNYFDSSVDSSSLALELGEERDCELVSDDDFEGCLTPGSHLVSGAESELNSGDKEMRSLDGARAPTQY